MSTRQKLTKLQTLRDLSSLIVRSKYNFFSEGKFWNITQIPLRKELNLMKAGLDNFFPGDRAFSQPTGMMIEPTDLCNLHCTGCWTSEKMHYQKLDCEKYLLRIIV